MTQLILGMLRLDGAQAAGGMLDSMRAAIQPAGLRVSCDLWADGPIVMASLAIDPNQTAPPTSAAMAKHGRGIVAADAKFYGESAELNAANRLADTLLSRPPHALATDALGSAHGDFALAVWDCQQSLLTLVRDHYGVRPLHYTHRAGEYVAFCSLPAGLLESGLASRTTDCASVASFVVNSQPLPGRTLFADVCSVRAAHCVTFDLRGKARSRRYWRQLIPEYADIDLDPRVVAAEVSRLLEQAVQRRVPATGPIAAHMSGGLDSTPIAVLAARAVRSRGDMCLAYSFQEPQGQWDELLTDETPYVAAAAEKEPNLSVMAVHSPSWLNLMMGEVDRNNAMPVSPDEPEIALLQDASRRGAGVMLSGWGGDEMVTSSGGGHMAELFWRGRWRQLRAQMQARRERTGHSLARQFWSLVVLRHLPPKVVPYYRKFRGLDAWHGKDRLLNPPLRRLVRREMRPIYRDSRKNRRVGVEAWWIQYRLGLFADLGARFGISYAYPMLDKDLVDYVMRLPGIFFHRHGMPRSLIRDATVGILPDLVRLRNDKFAPFPLEALRVAEARDSTLAFIRSLAAYPLVTQFLDLQALAALVSAGQSPQQIRAAMLANSSAGRQYTSDEDDYELPLQLAVFLRLQSQHRTTADEL